MAERGTPILNDPLYDTEKPCGRLMLVATELGVSHPRSGKHMTFRIKLSGEFTLAPASSTKKV